MNKISIDWSVDRTLVYVDYNPTNTTYRVLIRGLHWQVCDFDWNKDKPWKDIDKKDLPFDPRLVLVLNT